MKDRGACLAWVLTFAVLPLSHVTGLRYTLVVLAILLTLAGRSPRQLKEVPAIKWIAALLAWALASCAWSVDPAVSWGKWRSDLLVPFLAYAATFLWSREASGRAGACIASGLFACLVLVSLLSAFAFMPPTPIDALLGMQEFSSFPGEMPQWFPGAQDGSFFAALAVVAIVAWDGLRPAQSGRRMAIAALLMVGFITLVVRNRIVVAAIIAALVTFAWLGDAGNNVSRRGIAVHGRTFGWTRAIVLALALGFATFVALEQFSRERLRVEHVAVPAWGLSVGTLVTSDPRPATWAHYIPLAMERPVIGYGFGRTVPSMAAGSNGAAFVFPHAHNIFLDLWLQLGAVGLALFIALLAAIAREAAARSGDSPQARTCFAAVSALIVAMLIRNMSDDLMVYGLAVMFWALAGAMLGRQRIAGGA